MCYGNIVDCECSANDVFHHIYGHNNCDCVFKVRLKIWVGLVWDPEEGHRVLLDGSTSRIFSLYIVTFKVSVFSTHSAFWMVEQYLALPHPTSSSS